MTRPVAQRANSAQGAASGIFTFGFVVGGYFCVEMTVPDEDATVVTTATTAVVRIVDARMPFKSIKASC